MQERSTEPILIIAASTTLDYQQAKFSVIVEELHWGGIFYRTVAEKF